MENAHRTTDLTTGLTPQFGRGPALAVALGGTLALGWLVAMAYVIAVWALGG